MQCHLAKSKDNGGPFRGKQFLRRPRQHKPLLNLTKAEILTSNSVGTQLLFLGCNQDNNSSRVSNIESDNSQNVGLEDYNNISDGIFPHFTTPSIKISLG